MLVFLDVYAEIDGRPVLLFTSQPIPRINAIGAMDHLLAHGFTVGIRRKRWDIAGLRFPLPEEIHCQRKEATCEQA